MGSLRSLNNRYEDCEDISSLIYRTCLVNFGGHSDTPPPSDVDSLITYYIRTKDSRVRFNLRVSYKNKLPIRFEICRIYKEPFESAWYKLCIKFSNIYCC